MKKVLVTGSSGYIGSRVVRHLVNAGHDVIATSRKPSSSLTLELGVDVYELDVLHPRAAWKKATRVDCLIHCATANDILSKDFRAGIDLSVSGTWQMLEFAKVMKISHVLFFSTFQIYGTELNGTISEATPVNCESVYGLNHWFGEEACRLFSKQHGLAISILRPSNVYGVPIVSSVNRDTLVPMCFVREALESGAVTLRSSGKQRRNFVSTAEVADACVHLIKKPHCGFQIFNICSDLLASMKEIACLVGEVYEGQFQKKMDIKILSDQPEQGNHFFAESKLNALWPIKERSWEMMREEIRGLFKQFSAN